MDKRKQTKRPDFRRRCIQLVSALLYNANLSGFASGTIYKGDLKGLCVPGLNCYSCPGAVAACPLGSLQNALSALPNKLPLYIAGFLLLVGLGLGRIVCGFLCPALQAPRPEAQKGPLEPPALLAEVRRAGGVRRRHPPVVRLCGGLSPARLLQIYLPRRHPGGGRPPGGPERVLPAFDRVAVYLENGPVRRHPAFVCILLPGLLPLFVPPGGHLFLLLPGGPVRRPGGRGEVRRLRPLHPQVPDGREEGGGPGVHPVRPLPPYLPQRGDLFRMGKETNG